MRRFLFALAVLTFAGTFAFAQVGLGSCSVSAANQLSVDGWNQSSLSVCVDGDIVTAIDFAVTDAVISLTAGALAPGSNFTIRFHVVNQSDRSIQISDTLKAAITGTNFHGLRDYIHSVDSGMWIAAGGSKDYDIQVNFPSNRDTHDLLADFNNVVGYGQTINVPFTIVGNGEVPNVTAVHTR